MPAPANRLTYFIGEYHLWWLIIFLCLLGTGDTVKFAVRSYYEVRTEIDDATYSYRQHHIENQRRYEQLTRNDDKR